MKVRESDRKGRERDVKGKRCKGKGMVRERYGKGKGKERDEKGWEEMSMGRNGNGKKWELEVKVMGSERDGKGIRE